MKFKITEFDITRLDCISFVLSDSFEHYVGVSFDLNQFVSSIA